MTAAAKFAPPLPEVCCEFYDQLFREAYADMCKAADYAGEMAAKALWREQLFWWDMARGHNRYHPSLREPIEECTTAMLMERKRYLESRPHLPQAAAELLFIEAR